VTAVLDLMTIILRLGDDPDDYDHRPKGTGLPHQDGDSQ
jgi:hypothetical protein